VFRIGLFRFILSSAPGGRLLVGAGEENAGLVDIGDGLAVAFKIERHFRNGS